EALGEAPQLTLGGRTLVEIDEVHGDAPFGEESLRLARVLAVLEAEDLDVEHRVRRRLRARASLELAHLLLQLGPHLGRDGRAPERGGAAGVGAVIVRAAGGDEAVL